MSDLAAVRGFERPKRRPKIFGSKGATARTAAVIDEFLSSLSAQERA
jgi:hypothetical protein